MRQLSDREFLEDPKPCRVEGCEEQGRFQRSWFFRVSANGKRWQRHDRVCAAGAQEFANQFQLVIGRPPESSEVGR